MINPAALFGSVKIFAINEKDTILIDKPAIFTIHLYALLLEKTNFRSIIKINKIIDKKQENMKIKIIPKKTPKILASPLPNSCENVCETFISILCYSKLIIF
jgi:hypothetical protein